MILLSGHVKLMMLAPAGFYYRGMVRKEHGATGRFTCGPMLSAKEIEIKRSSLTAERAKASV